MKGKAKSKPALSVRERMLLLALPAALVLAIYSFAFNNAHTSELTRVNRQLGQMRQQAAALPAEKHLEAGLTALKNERQNLQHQLDAFTTGGGDGLQRSEMLVQVIHLLQAHGLIVIEETPVAQAGAATAQPARSTTGRPTAIPVESIWQIRFVGAWDAVRGALEAMPGEPAITCLPVSLDMAESQDLTNLREWTLRLRF